MELFRSFNTPGIAGMLTELLDEHGIDYEVYQDNELIENFDPQGIYGQLNVYLNKDDFEKVDEIIEKRADEELDTIEKDYFLFQFSNDELRDILIKADEWSPLDIALARKLLRERGEKFSVDEIQKLREERVADSAKPKAASSGILILCFICVLIFPLVPLIAGPVFAWSKKHDLAGNSVPTYDKPTQSKGRIMLIATLVLIATGVVVNLWV